jgi:hypothetical protein
MAQYNKLICKKLSAMKFVSRAGKRKDRGRILWRVNSYSYPIPTASEGFDFPRVTQEGSVKSFATFMGGVFTSNGIRIHMKKSPKMPKIKEGSDK